MHLATIDSVNEGDLHCRKEAHQRQVVSLVCTMGHGNCIDLFELLSSALSTSFLYMRLAPRVRFWTNRIGFPLGSSKSNIGSKGQVCFCMVTSLWDCERAADARLNPFVPLNVSKVVVKLRRNNIAAAVARREATVVGGHCHTRAWTILNETSLGEVFISTKDT